MNTPQEIFGIFYAIFWGAVFSVSSRWKAFNLGLIFDKKAPNITKRFVLAKVILNLLPICYFIVIFYILGDLYKKEPVCIFHPHIEKWQHIKGFLSGLFQHLV